MRVIAGSARSLKLKTLEGLDTRPTTDRIKETLFNMLQNDIPGARFLDLFSGSGAIGIEALSRGAEYAAFVENNRNAVKCIEENLTHTKLKEKAEIFSTDCLFALQQLKNRKPFDIIFMDPPYDRAIEEEVLLHLKDSPLITEDTLIIVEASLNTGFSYLSELGFSLYREKRYKTNKHVFIRKGA